MNSFSEESYVTDPTTTQPTLFLTPLSRTGYLLTALYLTLVGIVSTIGNITVLCVLCRYGTFRKRSVNILLMNMAVSDLGVSVAGYPLTAISGYRGRWAFADIGCQFSGFCVYALSCSTISTHAVIAIYRYIYIVKPNHRPRLSSSTSCFAILCIWTFSLFWTVTPFFGWSSYTYEPFGTSCSINWNGKSLGDLTYMISCVVFVFIIPIIIMLYCYIGVAKKIKGIDPLRTEERDIAVVFGRLRKHETKIDTRVTKICFMMMASFIVVWTPYAVGSLWASQIGKISASASVLPTMFAKSSCMINPIIFLTSSSKFRHDLGKLWNRPSSPEHTIRVEERSREQRSFFVRQSALPDARGSHSASVYYDKERIYIGEMRAANMQKEADLLHRDPEAISIASSTSSSLRFVVKDRQNRYKKKAGEASEKGLNILHFPYDDTEGNMMNNLMRPRSLSVTSDNISRVFAPSRKRPTKKRSMSHPDIPSTSADIFTVSPTTITNLQKQ